MTRSLTLACLIVLAVIVPNASAATAPGRVAFAVASQASFVEDGNERLSASAALPGGSVLTFYFDGPTQTTRAMKLTRDGSLDPGFGAGGVVSLSGPGRGLRVTQAVPLPDGRLLIAATTPDVGSGVSRVVLLRRMSSGAPDPSFGADGVVATSIREMRNDASLSGGPMAVTPDGSIVVTGSMLVPGEPSPLNPSTTDWVVVRLTPAGALDPTFGVVKIPVGGRRAEGTSVALTPSGSIVVLGSTDETSPVYRQTFALAGLTALGTPDPAFNGGAPLTLSMPVPYRVEPRASGALDVFTGEAVARLTATGTPDATFATNGELTFAPGSVMSFVATPDGDALLQIRAGSYEPPDIDRRIGVRRLSPAGVTGAATTLPTPFGGGFTRPVLRNKISLRQNTFSGSLLRRDDGSFLVIGKVEISAPTGKPDHRVVTPFVAAQAFTPALTPDSTFGGPQEPASLKVEVRRQRARTAAARGSVGLRVTASQPGLVFLRIRDARNRVLASGMHPIRTAGSTIMRVKLVAAGRRALSRARRGVRISVGHAYRDILTATASGVTRGRLP